jgi:hypothetical protein
MLSSGGGSSNSNTMRRVAMCEHHRTLNCKRRNHEQDANGVFLQLRLLAVLKVPVD